MPLFNFILYFFLSNLYCFLFQYTYGDQEAEYHFIRIHGQELVLLKNSGIIHFERVAMKKPQTARQETFVSTICPDYLAIIQHGDGIESSILERKWMDIKFEPLSSLCGRSKRYIGLKLLSYVLSEQIISYLFMVN